MEDQMSWANGTYCIRGWVGKAEGKRPFGRLRSTQEDNIKIDCKEIGRKDVHWINVALDMEYWRALVNPAMNLLVP
jgi:hypothetical protein